MAMNFRLLRPLATGFNPRSIAGLLAWYDASDQANVILNSTTVERLNDKSGNNRNATQTSNALWQPTYITAGQNGKNVLRFDGTNDQMACSIPVSAGITLFWVGTPATSNDKYLVCGSGSGGRPAIISKYNILVGGISARRDYTYFGGGGDAAVIATTASGFSVVAYTLVDGGAMLGYINGTQTVTFTPAGAISGTNITAIGSTGSAAHADADMGEFLVWNRVLSASERQRVERALGRKWGITVA